MKLDAVDVDKRICKEPGKGSPRPSPKRHGRLSLSEGHLCFGNV